MLKRTLVSALLITSGFALAAAPTSAQQAKAKAEAQKAYNETYTNVLADQLAPNRHLGWYLGGTVGTNLYYLGAFSSEGSFSSEGFTGFSWSGEAGYHFTRLTALELGVMQNYAKFQDEDNQSQSGNANAYYAVVRFDVPIKDSFTFIAKLGLTYASAVYQNDKENNPETPSLILPFTGIGFGYAINKNLAVNVTYQGAVYGIAGAGGFGAGLDYYFNK